MMSDVDEDRLAALVLAAAFVAFISLGGLFLLANDNVVAIVFSLAALASLAMLLWQVSRIRRRRNIE